MHAGFLEYTLYSDSTFQPRLFLFSKRNENEMEKGESIRFISV